MPKISVVIPVYKVEKYIDKCIRSVREQTLQDIEIILVDDGSTDCCPQICEEYAKADPRIIVIHKKNGGLSDARNTGINMASGKYIGFVDSDDYISRDMYEVLYELCEEYKAEMAVCDFQYVYEETVSNMDFMVTNEVEIISYTPTQAFGEVLNLNGRLRMGAWNKLYRADLFQTIRFPTGKLYEDVGTTYKLIFQSNNIIYIKNKPMYFYLRQRTGAITSRKYDKREYDKYELAEEMIKYIRTNHPELLPEATGYKHANCHLTTIGTMIRSNLVDSYYLRIVKKDISDELQYILKSSLSVKKKFQILLLKVSFSLYRILYLILNN